MEANHSVRIRIAKIIKRRRLEMPSGDSSIVRTTCESTTFISQLQIIDFSEMDDSNEVVQ
jgi:hypothetical protein